MTKKPFRASAHIFTIGLALCLVCILSQPSQFQTLEPLNRGATTNSDGKTRLWPGSRFTEADRRQAILRGLRFVYRNSLRKRNFDRYGSDYLWCYYTISASVSDEEVRQLAERMGVERARRWRQLHPDLPATADADTVADFVFGSDGADSLGILDEGLKRQIQAAVRHFRVRDFLPFDPVNEPPPADIPEECAFDYTMNPRGSRVCRKCRRRLRMRSRYDVWCDALVTTYSGEHYGVKLGADYQEVLKWLPALRPYPHSNRGANNDFIESVYAVTHVVYTLNDYDQYRLPIELLPDEYEFLRGNLRRAIALRDQDMLGEFIDSLKSLGLTEADPGIRLGIDYLLAHQNSDGSWGNKRARNNYDRYHPTWNGIVALSNYAWRGTGPNSINLQLLNDLRRRNGRPN
jgi:hypothetical protein